MKPTVKEILNELEHLLRNANPEDFLIACKRKSISKYMKSALEFLALECLEKTSNLKNSNMAKPYGQTPQRPRLRKKNIIAHSSGTNIKTEIDQLYEVLTNSKYFADKSTMENLVKYSGLKITFKKKDSKARVARNLAKAIASSPEQIKKNFLSMLNVKFNDQTKGWFDVIRSK